MLLMDERNTARENDPKGRRIEQLDNPYLNPYTLHYLLLINILIFFYSGDSHRLITNGIHSCFWLVDSYDLVTFVPCSLCSSIYSIVDKS